MGNRASKLRSVADALADVRDGSMIIIGGSLFHNKPMTLVRELVRRRMRGLTVITPCQASIDADLLISAGCVAEVRLPYMGFDYLGLSPGFRKGTSDGTLRAWECDETQVLCALESAAKDLPSGLVKTGVGTDLPRVNPDLKEVQDPITGEAMIAVGAFKPEFALLHAAAGDMYGNLRYPGYSFADLIAAEATRRSGGTVIASVDEVVPLSHTERDPHRTDVSQMLVDFVVDAPFGAHPCSSHGNYQFDEAGLQRYLQAAREDAMDDYVAQFVDQVPTQDAYLDRHVKPSTIVALRRGIHG
ncbi:CoA-transferase [Bradyrhizobium sp. LHD-71]|uniref:CoA transferase subunit A n=1 Tax=Bradyrhizobium sp. LHD-71 TaxID=3072141 RepID=UPI00280EC5CF|nr:CoA-transferase [Bradyrhizobium sp. LHD-71]MDQ8727420.1 CoA-transferase [Bradyrhizobium sp. LHD-71]